MRIRLPILIFAAALAALSGWAQAPHKAGSAVPRTPEGHPDLQGIWTNVTLTPMERQPQYTSLEISEAEALAFEKKEKARTIDGPDLNNSLLQSAGSAGTGAYNDLFNRSR